jgi:positive regulator of sigma E activity
MMEKRIEEGTVVAVAGEECVVRLRPTKEDACRNCMLCVAAARDSEERRTMKLSGVGAMPIGSCVHVEIRQPNSAVAAMVIFGVPLVALAAGGIMGDALASLMGQIDWIGAATGAGLGLCAGCLVVKRTERRWVPSARIIPEGYGEAEGTDQVSSDACSCPTQDRP